MPGGAAYTQAETLKCAGLSPALRRAMGLNLIYFSFYVVCTHYKFAALQREKGEFENFLVFGEKLYKIVNSFI